MGRILYKKLLFFHNLKYFYKVKIQYNTIVTKLIILFKGTDWLCKVVKLTMHCCGQILLDSFETYNSFPRCIISQFECIVDVQNHEFRWVRFKNRVFLLLLNNNYEKKRKNDTEN